MDLFATFRFMWLHFAAIVEELIAEGRVKGQIAGGRSEKATFLPAIHTQTQNKWIDNFYAQNNYIGKCCAQD